VLVTIPKEQGISLLFSVFWAQLLDMLSKQSKKNMFGL
jgi:hypothetical protein